jgi:hypothetical protein
MELAGSGNLPIQYSLPQSRHPNNSVSGTDEPIVNPMASGRIAPTCGHSRAAAMWR